jgi:hypothetical protein
LDVESESGVALLPGKMDDVHGNDVVLLEPGIPDPSTDQCPNRDHSRGEVSLLET